MYCPILSFMKYDLFKKRFGKANCPKTSYFFNMISFPFHVHRENEFDYMINSVKNCTAL